MIVDVGVAAHTILSVTHTDTLADTVVRGDLLYGNSTPKWARLPKPGVLSGLSHDGTDVSWVTATGTGAPVRATASTLTGVTITGSGNVLIADTPTLIVDGTNHRVGVLTTTPSTPLHVVGTAPGAITTASGASINASMFVDLTSTDVTDTGLRLVQAQLTLNPASANNKIGVGMAAEVIVPTGNTTDNSGMSIRALNAFATNNGSANTLSECIAGFYNPVNSGGGTVTAMTGISVKPNNSSGTVTTLKVFEVRNLSNAGTKIDDTYGYYCGDITAGTQTNGAWSFYASDAGAKNLFAGPTQFGAAITKVNNIATVGSYGVPALFGSGRSTAQTAAVASVATYTASADGTFQVVANVRITTSTTFSFNVNCTYTDEQNAAQTVNLPFRAGTLLTNAGGAVPYEGIPISIRAKSGTAITILTAGTFTTVTYNVEGQILQLT